MITSSKMHFCNFANFIITKYWVKSKRHSTHRKDAKSLGIKLTLYSITRNCNELEGNFQQAKASLPSETPFKNILAPLLVMMTCQKYLKLQLCRQHGSNGGTIDILPTTKR